MQQLSGFLSLPQVCVKRLRIVLRPYNGWCFAGEALARLELFPCQASCGYKSNHKINQTARNVNKTTKFRGLSYIEINIAE